MKTTNTTLSEQVAAQRQIKLAYYAFTNEAQISGENTMELHSTWIRLCKAYNKRYNCNKYLVGS